MQCPSKDSLAAAAVVTSERGEKKLHVLNNRQPQKETIYWAEDALLSWMNKLRTSLESRLKCDLCHDLQQFCLTA